ncbi:MAG: tetratricopeptide repeat protein [Candidatus Hodarchaeales archaeon]|jgi:tetratricopeptide (TPR) repeat protein
MNFDSNLIKILDSKILQITEGKISLEELEILNEILNTPNLLLSTKTGIKCWLALGYINLDLKEKFVSIIQEIVSETSSDGVEAFKIIKNIEFILDSLGQYLLQLNEYELAQKTFRLALDQAKLESNTHVIATISSHLAFSYYHLKDFEKSSRLLEIASSIYPDIQDSFTSLILSAKLKYKQNDLLKTISLLENALRLSKRINDKSMTDEISYKIVDLQREVLIKGLLQEDEKIFQFMETTTQRLKELGKEDEISALYYECGMILEKKGYLDEAILYYEEASRISYDNELWPLYARVSLQLGLMAFNQQDIEIATSYCDQVFQIAEYIGDKDLEKLGTKLQSAIQKATALKLESGVQIKDPLTTSEPSGPEETFLTESDNSSASPTVPEIQPEIKEPMIVPDVTDSISVPELELDSFASLHDVSEQTQVEDFDPAEILEEHSEIESSPPQRTFDYIRNEISNFLTNHGFIVEFDITPYNGTSSIDIIASKGNIRKKKMYIMISGNEGEASLAGYLFNSLSQSGKKIIYLETGNPEVVVIPKDVTITTSVEEIPLSF